jgi:two-component SAPR family response regulator
MITHFRVLIVDDDPMTLSLLSQMVKTFGVYEIVACQSAKEAIEKISVWQPDVILSDFMMDNGDGIDLLKNVRKEYGHEIPFVFITCVTKEMFTPLISNEVNICIIPKPLKLQNIKEIFTKLDLILDYDLSDKKRAA